MAKPSIRFEDEMPERIDSEPSYGDSPSVWTRHAIKLRMRIDPVLKELYKSYQREERLKLVEAAVRKEVDRRKREVNGSNGSNGGN